MGFDSAMGALVGISDWPSMRVFFWFLILLSPELGVGSGSAMGAHVGISDWPSLLGFFFVFNFINFHQNMIGFW